MAVFARPLQGYRDLGLLTGDDVFPAVGTVATLAGPADSTLVLVGFSFPAAALQFQREDPGFTAAYLVSLRFSRDGQLLRMVDRRETVRVHGFAETTRSDEAVLFQTAVSLEPGAYEIAIRIRDARSARGVEIRDTLRVPGYGPGRMDLASPVSVHEATPRSDRDLPPRAVLNTRHSVPFGSATATVYVEAYRPDPARVRLMDGHGRAVWTGPVALAGGIGLTAGVLQIPLDSLPPGRFRMVVEAGGSVSEPAPLVIAISDAWVLDNLDEVVDLLLPAPSAEEVERLRTGSTEERRQGWDAFWAVRDPIPATPANERRDTFFDRLRVAAEQFAEPGRSGWRTDRGEVYIVLGPPTRLVEAELGERGGSPLPAQEWRYDRLPHGGRLNLVFVDRHGRGTFQMTQASRTAFRNAADRLTDAW